MKNLYGFNELHAPHKGYFVHGFDSALNSGECTIGYIQGQYGTIKAAVHELATDEDDWHVVSLKNAQGQYDSFAVLGAADDEHAQALAVAYCGRLFDAAVVECHTSSMAGLQRYMALPQFAAKSQVQGWKLDEVQDVLTSQPAMWDEAKLVSHNAQVSNLLLDMQLNDDNCQLLQKFDGLDALLAELNVEVADFDSIVTTLKNLEKMTATLHAAMNHAATAGGVTVVNAEISKPFKRQGVAQIAISYDLSDGQTITLFMHHPTLSAARLKETDELISWKIILNKRDVSGAVHPNQGQKLDAQAGAAYLRNLAARIMQLAQKNSARFARTQAKKSEQAQALTEAQQRVMEKQDRVDALQAEIADLNSRIDEMGQMGQSAKRQKIIVKPKSNIMGIDDNTLSQQAKDLISKDAKRIASSINAMNKKIDMAEDLQTKLAYQKQLKKLQSVLHQQRLNVFNAEDAIDAYFNDGVAFEDGNLVELFPQVKAFIDASGEAKANEQAVSNEDEQPIILTGKELGEFPDTPEGKKQLREAAFKNLLELADRKIRIYCPALKADVMFNKSGAKKFKSLSADVEKIKVAVAIKDIIKQGVLIKKDIASYDAEEQRLGITYDTLSTNIKINGNERNVITVIRKLKNGKYEYDFTIEKKQAVKNDYDSVNVENPISQVGYKSDVLTGLNIISPQDNILVNGFDAANGEKYVLNLFVYDADGNEIWAEDDVQDDAAQYSSDNPYAAYANDDADAKKNADDWEARKPLTEKALEAFNQQAEQHGFVTLIESRHANLGRFQAEKSVDNKIARIDGEFKNSGGTSVYENARDFTLTKELDGDAVDYAYSNDLGELLKQADTWLNEAQTDSIELERLIKRLEEDADNEQESADQPAPKLTSLDADTRQRIKNRVNSDLDLSRTDDERLALLALMLDKMGGKATDDEVTNLLGATPTLLQGKKLGRYSASQLSQEGVAAYNTVLDELDAMHSSEHQNYMFSKAITANIGNRDVAPNPAADQPEPPADNAETTRLLSLISDALDKGNARRDAIKKQIAKIIGEFDKQDRYWVKPEYKTDSLEDTRTPSAKWNLSYYKHVMTDKYLKQLYDKLQANNQQPAEPTIELERLIKRLEEDGQIGDSADALMRADEAQKALNQFRQDGELSASYYLLHGGLQVIDVLNSAKTEHVRAVIDYLTNDYAQSFYRSMVAEAFNLDVTVNSPRLKWIDAIAHIYALKGINRERFDELLTEQQKNHDQWKQQRAAELEAENVAKNQRQAEQKAAERQSMLDRQKDIREWLQDADEKTIANAEKILNQKVRYDTKVFQGVATRKQFIEGAIKKGAIPRVNKVHPFEWDRLKFNRMDYEEQQAYQARYDKLKDEYGIGLPNEEEYSLITKTEFNYAQYLLSKNNQGNAMMNNQQTQAHPDYSQDDIDYLNAAINGEVDFSQADEVEKRFEAISERLDSPEKEALFEKAADAFAQYAISLEV